MSDINPNDFRVAKVFGTPMNWWDVEKNGSKISIEYDIWGPPSDFFVNTPDGRLIAKKLEGLGHNYSEAQGNVYIATKTARNTGAQNDRNYLIPAYTSYGMKGWTSAGDPGGTWGQQTRYLYAAVTFDKDAYDAAIKESDSLAAKQELADKKEAEKLRIEEQKNSLAEQKRKIEEERQQAIQDLEAKKFEIEKRRFENEAKKIDTDLDVETHIDTYGDIPLGTIEVEVYQQFIPGIPIPIDWAYNIYSDKASSMGSQYHQGRAFAGEGIWESMFPDEPYPRNGPIVVVQAGRVKPFDSQMLAEMSGRFPQFAGELEGAKNSVRATAKQKYKRK